MLQKNVVRYKARLIAQGFLQVPGVDYFDTFTPVGRLSSIRVVLAIAPVRDYSTGQIDIKGAYLNITLTSLEVILMKQPPGYSIPSPSGKTFVSRLSPSQNFVWLEAVRRVMVPAVGGDYDGEVGLSEERCRPSRVLSKGEREGEADYRVGTC